MDTGDGRLHQVTSQALNDMFGAAKVGELKRVFQEGEIVRIKGSQFRIDRIKHNGLRLLLLPD